MKRDERSKVNMSFKIKSDSGPEKEVTFAFDTKADTPSGVAKEMVRELQIHSDNIALISK